MEINDAIQLVKDDGFDVVGLLEESDGVFVFSCNGDNDSEIVVSVVDGNVAIAPT